MNTVIITSVILSLLGQSSPVSNLALTDAVNRAVRNNRDLKESGARIAISKGAEQASKGRFDINVNAKLQGSYLEAQPVEGSFMSVTSSKSINFEAGVSKMLKTGGIVALTMKTSRTQTEQALDLSSMGNPVPMNLETKSMNTSLSLTVSHPLLAGMGVEINTADIKKAALNREVEEINQTAKAETVVRDVINAWLNLDLAWKQYDVLMGSLKVAKNQLHDTEALLKAGMGKESDLLAVKAAVAQREVEIENMRSMILKASLNLADLMGVKLTASSPIFRPSGLKKLDTGSLDNIVKTAIDRSKTLAALARQLESNAVDKKVADNMLLPRLDVSITAGPTMDSTKYTETLKNLYRFDAFMVGGGLSFSTSIEKNQAKGYIETVRQTRRILDLQKERLMNLIAMSAVIARNDYESAQKRIVAARISVKASELHLENENKLFKLGRGTNHSVLLRLTELDSAKLGLEKALYDLEVAKNQIFTLSGTILARYGISVESLNR